MIEQKICDHCKNADIPLTETNGQEIFQRDSEGKKVVLSRQSRPAGSPRYRKISEVYSFPGQFKLNLCFARAALPD
jgi:hypothetical protein